MGKQKSGGHIRGGKSGGGAAAATKMRDEMDENASNTSFLWPVLSLLIASVLAGYFLYPLAALNGQTASRDQEWTPYTVTGNLTVTTLPSPTSSFAGMCAKRGVPVVLRNSVVTQWKAAKLWTPDYLQAKLETLHGVYENDNRWFGPYFDQSKPLNSSAVRINKYKTDLRLSSEEFFQRVQNPVRGRHLYLTGGIEQLGRWAEEHIQPISELLTLNPSRSSINVWIGQPHVIAHCHYDGYHNFYAQLYGRKKFTLFRPTNWPGLYPYPFLHPSHAQAQINISERADTVRYPLIGSVEAVEVVLEPGDLLYMPPLWFHHVESMTVSISVNVWTDSKQTELVEKMFSVPPPLVDRTLPWRSSKSRSIATAILIYRLIETICKYQACADVHTDKFVEGDLDDKTVKTLDDKVLYFVHRLWSVRYRTLMNKKQLPSELQSYSGEGLLCEEGASERDREAFKEAERILEGVRFGAYVTEMSLLVRGLPVDTWELWVGNFIEYVVAASGAVTDVEFVGLFLKAFGSCIVLYGGK